MYSSDFAFTFPYRVKHGPELRSDLRWHPPWRRAPGGCRFSPKYFFAVCHMGIACLGPCRLHECYYYVGFGFASAIVLLHFLYPAWGLKPRLKAKPTNVSLTPFVFNDDTYLECSEDLFVQQHCTEKLLMK